MLGKHIKHCEDSLTAAIFSHLFHLPSETFWRMLRNASYSLVLPEKAGEPSQLDYWPKWAPGESGNALYVEPDVFIRFDDFDLIIEAKLRDDGTQDRGQWTRELAAYACEYGREKRPVCMIALGGLDTEVDVEIKYEWRDDSSSKQLHKITCTVHMCRWRRLLYQCQQIKRELERVDAPNSRNLADRRILTDMTDLFACHGYSTGRWYEDFDFARHALRPRIDRSLKILRQISLQYSRL